MDLRELVPDAPQSFAGRRVAGFAIDSRKVSPGTIFGAFHGTNHNGEDHVADAVAAGAIAVVARPGVPVTGAVLIADESPRRRFANLAARFYHPMPDTVVAVTGTNGKTSVAELTRQLWGMAGHRAASIGTLGVTVGDDRTTTGLTTPDVVTFLANLHGLAREGVSHAIYEASSHGLDQHRIDGVPLNVAAFTNLSRDHLDYHHTMEAYLVAKMRLFDDLLAADGQAVVWSDDNYSDQVLAHLAGHGRNVLTVGRIGNFIRLQDRTSEPLGQMLALSVDGHDFSVRLPLIGTYQAANALVAAAIVVAAGGGVAQTVADLARLQPVPGRLDRAAITRSGAVIYVDYAHTPDALAAACDALRPHASGRLITVCGAGGDRDPGKREAMGRIAAAKSDVLIITDDNPRNEDPALIRAAMLRGASEAQEIGDRRAAIAAAVAMAGGGDVILVAGKGHEQGQIIGERVYPFDDVEVARACAA